VNVNCVCKTTAATPVPAAKRRSRPKSLAGIRCDFDRLLRARLGTVAFRNIGRHLWTAGTLGQRCLVKIVELIAEEQDVAEAFFDQITTAACDARERIGFLVRPQARWQH
jgi:hypothetical protein